VLALLLALGGCGSDDSGEGDDESNEGSGPASTGNKPASGSSSASKFTGEGPAKSAAGRPFRDLCEENVFQLICSEYFSAKPTFNAGDENTSCHVRTERCSSKEVTGTCMRTAKNVFDEVYDVYEYYYTKNTKYIQLDQERCSENGGTWVEPKS